MLESARAKVEPLRFKGDFPIEAESSIRKEAEKKYLTDHLYNSALEITSFLTPTAHAAIERVKTNLELPNKCVTAFVVSSLDYNASCFVVDEQSAIVQISSGLVNLLTEEELSFVLGHEIGHFLLKHQAIGIEEEMESTEAMKIRRAREVSVDRVGLISVGSNENVALHALIKTASGLSDQHLNFDVGAFISQANEISNRNRHIAVHSTHPAIVLRARALLWFSSALRESQDLKSAILTADKLVEKDMDRFIDQDVNLQIILAREEVGKWLAAKIMLEKPSISQKSWLEFEDTYGSKTSQKLKRFLSETHSEAVKERVTKNLNVARGNLKKMLPITFDNEYEEINAQASRFLNY